MDFKFNHTKETLAEAIGAPSGALDEFSDKFSEFCNKVVKDKTTETSKVVEEVLNTFSYSDLVLATSLYAERVIKDARKEKKRKQHF